MQKSNNKQPKIVQYGELRPCKTAFIDAHTVGSDQKENFTIIGAGVSESSDQHVHIKESPGFNIGAAGQPPRCKNSLHSHRTAEVFFVAKGRWRFFWGRWGKAGEVILEEGDIFNIPTGIFRSFENIGNDYGMLMAILGGDNAGGGVIWAPQVIEEAQKYGLILGKNGKLYDSKKGQSLPESVEPMPVLTEQELKAFPEPKTVDVVSKHVARFWDLISLSDNQPASVIGEHAILKDKPGFEVDFLSRHSISTENYKTDRHEILMPVKGNWQVEWQDGIAFLNSGDCCLIPPELNHSIKPSMTGYSAMYRITDTDDQEGETWKPNS